MKFNNIISLKWLLLAIGLGLSAVTYADNTATTYAPEFVGGVTDNAIWQDAGFYKTANHCSGQYKCGLLSNQPEKMKVCRVQAQSCLADYMTKQGASKQAIAFMRYNDIPSTIAKIKHYKNLDVVYANMQLADANGGFFIITKAGFIVPVSNKFNLKQNAAASQRFLQQHPNAFLADYLIGEKNWPTVQDNAPNLQQVIFQFPIKEGCAACAIIGQAEIAFNFDAQNKFLGTQLIKITNV